MSTLTLIIVVVFVIGYLCIALETLTKVNKAAVALLMLVACWTLYMFDPGNFAGIAPDSIASAARQHGYHVVLPYGSYDYRRGCRPERRFQFRS